MCVNHRQERIRSYVYGVSIGVPPSEVLRVPLYIDICIHTIYDTLYIVDIVGNPPSLQVHQACEEFTIHYYNRVSPVTLAVVVVVEHTGYCTHVHLD